MKLCDKCGAVNSDGKNFCVDCGEKLGDPLTPIEEDKIEQSFDTKLENLYNDNDPLYVSRFDKVMGAVSLIGIAASVVFLVIGFLTRRETALLWLGIIFFAVAVIEAFVPKLNWTLEKIRLSFIISNPEEATPSGFYKICRKAAIVIAAAIGIIMLAFSVADFRHPPVVKYISDIANTESVAFSSNSSDYINANPEKWGKIIDGGDYTVSVLLAKLENADATGLEEHIMMAAIAEITGKEDLSFANKDEFLFSYRTYGWE